MSVRRFFRDHLSSGQAEKPGLTTWLFGLALLFLLFQFGVALSAYFQHASAALRFPYPLDYIEGPVLDQAMRLAAGETVYRSDLSNPPFTVVHDPPIFFLLQTPFTSAFGPSYAYGRAISMLGACLAALFIGLTLFTLSRDWLGALVSGLTLLSFPLILRGGALNQADMLALALSWAGLFCVVWWSVKRMGKWLGKWPGKWGGIVLAAVLFSMAIYTRQTYFLAAPLAAIAWLLQKRLYRPTLLLMGLVGGICLAVFLIMNALTQGGFYFNLFTANASPYSIKTVTAYLAQVLPHLFFLAISAILFLAVERLGDRTETWPLVLPYFTGAMIVALFSGFAGMGERVFYESSAAFALAAGAIISWVAKSSWLRTVLVLVLAFQVGGLIEWSRSVYIPQVMDRVAMQDEITEIDQLVRQAEGPFLADEYMGLAPLNGKRIYFQPMEFRLLSENRLWDNQRLVEQIQRKDFPVILLYIPMDNGQILSTRWSPAIRNAFWTNYRFVKTLAFVYIYEPKP